jgi:hypothetical protein
LRGFEALVHSRVGDHQLSDGGFADAELLIEYKDRATLYAYREIAWRRASARFAAELSL